MAYLFMIVSYDSSAFIFRDPVFIVSLKVLWYKVVI